jgi:hypothetical protein
MLLRKYPTYFMTTRKMGMGMAIRAQDNIPLAGHAHKGLGHGRINRTTGGWRGILY